MVGRDYHATDAVDSRFSQSDEFSAHSFLESFRVFWLRFPLQHSFLRFPRFRHAARRSRGIVRYVQLRVVRFTDGTYSTGMSDVGYIVNMSMFPIRLS